jgi:hypothetical protein
MASQPSWAERGESKLRSCRMIFAGMFLPLVGLGVALAMVEPPDDGDASLAGMLMSIALLDVGLVFFLRFLTLGPSMGLFAGLSRQDMTIEPQGVDAFIQGVIERYLKISVVGGAVAVSVGLFGWVAAFLSGNMAFYLVMSVLAAFLLALQFPRWSGILAMLPPSVREQAEQVVGNG